MANPQTINVQLDVPLRGSNPGTWDLPVNFDFSAIDGLFGGVGNVGLSSGPVTLTAPAGTAAPGAGPYQSQNAVIRFTGLLTAHVTVTLPLACYNIFENLTTGPFNVILRAVGAGEVIALPPGCRTEVYNDGTNARFVTGIMGRPGALSFETGEFALPAWVAACTVKPFLLCDGTVYNYSDFPYLGPKLAGKFGGNGITTFGVPGLGGANPLAYDYTGARITAAGSGLNGQVLGAFGGGQYIRLNQNQLPNNTLSVLVSGNTSGVLLKDVGTVACSTPLAGGGQAFPAEYSGPVAVAIVGSGNTSSLNGGVTQQVTPTLPPSMVTGVWLIKT